VSWPGTTAGALSRRIKRGWDGGFIETRLFEAATRSFSNLALQSAGQPETSLDARLSVRERDLQFLRIETF
jgi:hypothetical protein